jgi:NAD(P)-dependent dehydrogenase (short-subunit alcohol dehydrogenase family)
MGKSVVVTGANSGIGLATALELARTGYDVIGTVRSEQKAAGLRDEAHRRGLTLQTVICDVADASSTEDAFAEIAERTGGGPWAVVNNAGYAQPGAIEDVDDDLVHQQLEVNLVAPMRIARLVLPAMRARGEGRIINVSSIAGRVTSPLLGWYCASKHALEAATDALRMEVARFGVVVVLVEPGGFGTGIWAEGQGRFPHRDGSAYADAYARGDALTGRGGSLPDPIWVGRAIRLTLATPVPLARYLVGADAMAGVLVDSLIPTVVADYAKSWAAGLRTLPILKTKRH